LLFDYCSLVPRSQNQKEINHGAITNALQNSVIIRLHSLINPQKPQSPLAKTSALDLNVKSGWFWFDHYWPVLNRPPTIERMKTVGGDHVHQFDATQQDLSDFLFRE
jgi:hypothetical protein